MCVNVSIKQIVSQFFRKRRVHLLTHCELRLGRCCRLFQVSLVLSALQAGNKGTQACITAESAVSGIIADLDTTIMFASAGTLNPENEESFADHRYSDLAAREAAQQRTPGATTEQRALLEITAKDEWVSWSTSDATWIRAAASSFIQQTSRALRLCGRFTPMSRVPVN